jgi:hypothetical protein
MTRTQNKAKSQQMLRAFQADPSWYEAHWYDDSQPAARGVLARVIAAASTFTRWVADLRRLLAGIPSEFSQLGGGADVAQARQLLLGDTHRDQQPQLQQPRPHSGDQPREQHENDGAHRRNDDLVDDLAA